MRHRHVGAIEHVPAAGAGILHAQGTKEAVLEQFGIGMPQLTGEHITYGGVENVLVAKTATNGTGSPESFGPLQ